MSFFTTFGGTLDIQSDGSLTPATGQSADNVSHTNYGVMVKSAGGGTTLLTLDSIENVGSFQLNSGTVQFTSNTSKQAVNGSTLLAGGNLSVSSGYVILAGILEGSGIVYGDVWNGDPNDPLANVTGTVRPGRG